MRVGNPCQQGDAVRKASKGNPSGAGRFWPIAAEPNAHGVGHYAMAWLPPLSSRWAKIGSVTVGQSNVIWL